MRTMIIAASMISTSAFAADIPSRTAPLPPQRPVFEQPSYPFFVGIHVGTSQFQGQRSWSDNSNARVNVRAGWEFSPYGRLEGNYEYSWNEFSVLNSNTLTTNLIGQYRLGSVVPYVLVGGGYRWSHFKDEPVYNVGGGVRYEFTPRVEADLRYRYVFDRDRLRDENVVTLGVNYRF
jgi:opacity protein-like surface antigen